MEIFFVLGGLFAIVWVVRRVNPGTDRDRRPSRSTARPGHPPERSREQPNKALLPRRRSATPAGHVPVPPARLPALVRSTGPRRISGRAHVIDGDTIVIGRVKIRIAGIDAPELDMPYGQKAKWAMVAICKGQSITADLDGETSHDRFVGTCFLPDGRDIAAELVQQGLALDWPLFSGGKYRHLEPPGVRRKLWGCGHFGRSA